MVGGQCKRWHLFLTSRNDIESILVQIRAGIGSIEVCELLEMIEGGARLDFSNTSEYTESEALQAFKRVAQQHGWDK